MKLYLSSYRIGDQADRLKEMVGPNKKAALISNALDYSQDLERRAKSAERELDDLSQLGFEPEEIDLREYFGNKEALRTKLLEYGLIWVRGGNCFVLRRAFRESSLDEILQEFRGRQDLVYGGYSAGACVLAPSLRGLEIVDDATTVPSGYPAEVVWDGVGLIAYAVIPHYQSDHPESAAANQVVNYLTEHHIPFKTLHDGEVLVEEVL